jgi:hypothetical protein
MRTACARPSTGDNSTLGAGGAPEPAQAAVTRIAGQMIRFTCLSPWYRIARRISNASLFASTSPRRTEAHLGFRRNPRPDQHSLAL